MWNRHTVYRHGARFRPHACCGNRVFSFRFFLYSNATSQTIETMTTTTTVDDDDELTNAEHTVTLWTNRNETKKKNFSLSLDGDDIIWLLCVFIFRSFLYCRNLCYLRLALKSHSNWAELTEHRTQPIFHVYIFWWFSNRLLCDAREIIQQLIACCWHWTVFFFWPLIKRKTDDIFLFLFNVVVVLTSDKSCSQPRCSMYK